jgi:hypothetical protein
MSSQGPAQNIKNAIQSQLDAAARKQLSDLAKLGQTIATNQIVQAMRNVVGMAMSYVFDTSRDIRVRMEVLDSLIGWLYSFYAAKSDPVARQLNFEWSLLIGRHWYAEGLVLLNNRIAMGSGMNPFYPSLQVLTKICTKFCEKQLIPYGRLVVSVAFDEKMYTSEFTAMIQSMVMGSMSGDRRFGGSGEEIFAEDAVQKD